MLKLIRSGLDIAANNVARHATAAGSYRFADLSVNVRVALGEKSAGFLRMVEHRRVESPTADAAEIDIIEGHHPQLDVLLPPLEHRDKRLVESTDDFYYFWAPAPGSNVTAIDRKSRRALLWYTRAGEIASWEFSRPFMTALHGFMLPTAWTPVHAAALAKNGAAILVAGRGGVGKTTTALVCAEAGWDYLSDDFVLVGGTPPCALSLYRSARLREDMFGRLPRSMTAATNVSTDDGEVRAEVDVAMVGPVAAAAAEIRTVVVLQRAGAARPALVPLRRSLALSALAAPSLVALPGGRTETYAKIAELVGRVPCYGFEPGPRLEDIPGALAPLLERQ